MSIIIESEIARKKPREKKQHEEPTEKRIVKIPSSDNSITAYADIFVADVLIEDDLIFADWGSGVESRLKLQTSLVDEASNVNIKEIGMRGLPMLTVWPGHERLDIENSGDLVKKGLLLSALLKYPEKYFKITNTAHFREVYKRTPPPPGGYAIYKRIGTLEAKIIGRGRGKTLLLLTTRGNPDFSIEVAVYDDDVLNRSKKDELSGAELNEEQTYLRSHENLRPGFVWHDDRSHDAIFISSLNHTYHCVANLGFPYHPETNTWVIAGVRKYISNPEEDIVINIRYFAGAREDAWRSNADIRKDVCDAKKLKLTENFAGVCYHAGTTRLQDLGLSGTM